MGSAKLDVGNQFIVRAKYDIDLIEFITELAKKSDVMAATFTAIGSLKNGKLGFYDQETHEWKEKTLSGPLEIASCIGNISIKGEQPFVHAHAVLSDQEGNTKAGHLLEGKVFAAEIHVTELVGAKLMRKYDATTGLSLWDL